MHESFQDSVVQQLVNDDPYFASQAQHITEFDRLEPQHSASTLEETPTQKHIDEARVSILEYAGETAEQKYGVVEVPEENLPMHALKCMWGKQYSSSGNDDTSQITATLAITLFVQFKVNAMTYMLSLIHI